MGEIRHIFATPRKVVDALPADILDIVIIYKEHDGGWQTAYSRQDSSNLAFAEKILHREIMIRIEESRFE